MPTQASRLKVLGAGILSLILMLGVARFAYTPLLPLMQDQAGLGIAAGGWLATVNYLGYFSGVIIASLISNLVLKDRLYRIGLIIAVISTGGMAVTENVWIWGSWRYLAGLSSAAGLMLGSGLILNWLIRHGHRSELGIHFSGVGLGIALCSLAVEIPSRYLAWDELWWMFTVAGAVLLIPAWRWLPRPDPTLPAVNPEAMADQPPSPQTLWTLIVAYFCAGVGYVVSATFIVAIIDQLPGMAGRGAISFLIVGLAAAPACIFWDLVARRTGDLVALLLTYLLQIIGVLLPILSPGIFTAFLGAALFGATFIGTVSLVLTMAGRYYPSRPAKMMGKMTISYGIAQIAAPAITGLLAEAYGSYSGGLYLAAAALTLGSALIGYLIIKARGAAQQTRP